MKSNTTALITSALMFLYASGAMAVPCSGGNDPPISDNVTPSTNCEIGSTNNDKLQDPLQVNIDQIFGFDDWTFAEKYEFGDPPKTEEDIDIGLIITGGAKSGTWSIDDIWASLGVTELILVFKDGTNADPANYVAYLIQFGATSGTYLTPFKQTTGPGNAKDISHIAAYIRFDGIQIPEPSTPVLIALGLLLVVLVHRRRRTH